jgi:hypothetical protein
MPCLKSAAIYTPPIALGLFAFTTYFTAVALCGTYNINTLTSTYNEMISNTPGSDLPSITFNNNVNNTLNQKISNIETPYLLTQIASVIVFFGLQCIRAALKQKSTPLIFAAIISAALGAYSCINITTITDLAQTDISEHKILNMTLEVLPPKEDLFKITKSIFIDSLLVNAAGTLLLLMTLDLAFRYILPFCKTHEEGEDPGARYGAI